MAAKLLDVFTGLYQIELSKLDEALTREIDKGVSLLASRGMLQSGAAGRMLVNHVTDSLTVRAKLAFNLYTRHTNVYGVTLRGAAKEQALTDLAAAINAQSGPLKMIVANSAPFHGGASGPMKQSLEAVLPEIDRVAQRELQTIAGELDLMGAAAERRDQTNDQVSGSMNFHGPVGVVQTGAGSIGIANRHIDQGAVDAIRKALAELSAALKSDIADLPFDADDVMEMVRDGEAEIAKAKPNSARLKATLSGIGAAISYAPKLRAAYDTLKWACAFVGVSLP